MDCKADDSAFRYDIHLPWMYRSQQYFIKMRYTTMLTIVKNLQMLIHWMQRKKVSWDLDSRNITDGLKWYKRAFEKNTLLFCCDCRKEVACLRSSFSVRRSCIGCFDTDWDWFVEEPFAIGFSVVASHRRAFPADSKIVISLEAHIRLICSGKSCRNGLYFKFLNSSNLDFIINMFKVKDNSSVWYRLRQLGIHSFASYRVIGCGRHFPHKLTLDWSQPKAVPQNQIDMKYKTCFHIVPWDWQQIWY